jgi:hypothetical protein
LDLLDHQFNATTTSTIAASQTQAVSDMAIPSRRHHRRDGYEPIFLEIIRREKNKIEGGCFAIEQSFTCSKMRSDGFGGAMTMVTPEGVQGISTQEWLHKKLQQRDDGGVTVDLDQRELSSILAALRYMQSHMGNGDFRPDIDAIAANDNTIRPLDEDEIDALCERINCGR